MRTYTLANREQGTALIVALLMLLILAIIGISGMNDSIFDLRMAGNIQNYSDSLQQSDSGITAVLSQRDTLFVVDTDKNDIFATGGSNPLKDYITSTVNVRYLYEPPSCGASDKPNSEDFSCALYIIDSDYSDSATGANAHIYLGVTQEIMAIESAN